MFSRRSELFTRNLKPIEDSVLSDRDFEIVSHVLGLKRYLDPEVLVTGLFTAAFQPETVLHVVRSRDSQFEVEVAVNGKEWMKFPSYLPPFEYSVELDADQAKAIEQIWNLALRQTRPCESKCELLDGFSFIFFQKSDGEILSGSTALFPDPQSVPGQLTSLYGCLESLAIHSAEKPGESAFGRWKQRWRVRRIKRKICTIIRWYRQRELIE